MTRLTKVICTLGPATNSREGILRLAKTGMNIARINFSHGSLPQHEEVIRTIQDINEKEGMNIAVMLDTKGSEIRTGEVSSPMEVAAGETVIFSPRPLPKSDHKVILVNYDKFSEDVRETDRILLDNGELRYDIVEIQDDGCVLARAREAGKIGSRRHVNLPGAYINLPSITDKDWEDISLGCQLGADFVALSFIRSAKDVRDVRDFLSKKNAHMHIIAKIETKQAVEDLHNIIDASDGVMVARGDLGAEIPFELIPAIQDDIVLRCRTQGKRVIVATHMLESMIKNPMPTRAEVTDVAHAAVTRTDTTMLSGETASGAHPFEALEAMDRILIETERHLQPLHDCGTPSTDDTRQARAIAAVNMANSLKTPAIVVLTQSGKSAHAISSFRPLVPILAFTASPVVRRRLQMDYGVAPFLLSLDESDPENTVQSAIMLGKERGLLRSGDRIVLVTDSKVKDGVVSSVQVRLVA